jgi:hypothetical protein
MATTPPISSSPDKKLFIDNDTVENVQRYIDAICSDPSFLCSNKDMCTNSKQYTNLNDINKTCQSIDEANKCDHEFKECVVQANDTLEDGTGFVSTSFVNIIIPIKNEVDKDGNQKFLRLPPLSSSRSKKSKDICNICSCISRFATSSGSDTTSPGQNQCTYNSNIEYYYYPVDIENINSKLKKAPPVKLGTYKVVPGNIIYASSEEALQVGPLYDLLLENKVTEYNATQFINYLYKNDPEKTKELHIYLLAKNKKKYSTKGRFYQNISAFYIFLIGFIIILFFYLFHLSFKKAI